MFKYSKISLERLETCHPLIQEVFYSVIKVFDCSILCGHRVMEGQNKAFDEGHSRVKWPDSSHNATSSTAVDVAPYYKEKPHIRWDKGSLYRWYYFAGIVQGIAMSQDIILKWGGDWNRDTYVKNQKWNDLPHFELLFLNKVIIF